MVMILSRPRLISEIAAYSVVVLPEPVGCHQQHAIRFGREFADARQRDPAKAESFQRQPTQLFRQRLPVEYPQYCVFAENAWHHRYAHIDFASLHRHFEAAILRHAAFGDIEFGHHLDAGHGLLGDFHTRHMRDLRENAVDTVLDGQPAAVGFQDRKSVV